jgi:SNF2 family DNA or RNA helicase
MPKEYWVWRMQDCVGKYDHFAPQNLKVTGERVPGQLASSLTCYIAHYQRERCCKYHPNGFLAHLAPPIRIERDLTMTKAQAEFYHNMEKSYVAFLTTPDENGKVPVVAEFPITARGMLRFCALGLPSYNPDTEKLYFDVKCDSPKLDCLAEDLRALDGKRALILTHSKQFAIVAAQRLNDQGFNVATWNGDVTKKRRNEILDKFISGELDAIVGVISAMGTGTDGLQEAAYNVMWLSVDDDPSNVVQGIGRLDRLGQKHQVTMIEYRMLKTYDVGHLDRQITHMLELNRSLVKEKK